MGKRVTVKFKKDYVASRGNSIAGAKGDVKTFPASDDLDLCIKSGICTKVKDEKPAKKSKAARREKATKPSGEKS